MARGIRLDGEQRRMLRHLRIHGSTSRLGLARSLDLSPTSLTTLSRSLLDLGLVEEAESSSANGRGRPATPLRIASSGGYSVGIAIHRGVMEIAVVDLAGNLIDEVAEPFEKLTPADCAISVRKRLHEMVDAHDLLGSRVFGVGLGLPGYPRRDVPEHWMVIDSLADWSNTSLCAIFEEVLGLPAWVQNDANMAALAEFYLGGLMARCSNALVILVGHGIGAGIIADGRLLMGEHGNAGEIGCLYPAGEPRPSTIDLLGRLRAAGSAAMSITDIEEDIDAYAVIMDEWIVQAAAQLRSCIDAGLVWFNPGEIIISSPLPERLLSRLAGELNEHRLENGFYSDNPLTIGVTSLGHSAIALGAALLPIHQTEAVV